MRPVNVGHSSVEAPQRKDALMAERDRDKVREREVIVTDTGAPERSGIAGVIGILIAAAAVVLVVWLVVGSGVFDRDTDIDAEIPDEIDVNIDDGGDGGGGS
jgi:hypothetical protein